MGDTASTVRQLSLEQTKSLLALGLLSEPDHRARPMSRTVRHAAAEPGGQQLQQLLADLRSPVLAPTAGPLALGRLMELSEADLASVAGKTYLEAAKSPQTTFRVLDALAELGRLLSTATLSEAAQLFGVVLRALVRAAQATHYRVEIDEPGEIIEILETLNLTPGLGSRPARPDATTA